MKQKIYSKVISGHLTDAAELQLLSVLAGNEGKDVVVTVERGRMRSNAQNSYYFGVVVPAVQAMLVDFGNDVDAEETHCFLKEHVGKLVTSIRDKDGRKVAIVRSSATLTTVEWEAYMESIKRWAAQESVYIPDPREYGN